MTAMVAQQTSIQPLSSDLAAALDPVVFAQKCGIAPDRWQADVLQSSHKRMLLNCSRQSGKSTTTAIIGLHRATYHPGSLVLLISPPLRQSSELFRTVARLYGRLGETVPLKAESALRLELENGSRIVSLPASESTVRGFAKVDLLLVDEASRVEDDLYLSLRPMLAVSNGRMICMSTPFGKQRWWSDAWHDGGTVWERVRVDATECPRISPEFLAEERESLGEWWYRQEYLCEFVDSDSSAFRTEDVEAAQMEGVPQWSL